MSPTAQGAKEGPSIERSKVVCQDQVNSFYEGIVHVSAPHPFSGSFPCWGARISNQAQDRFH